MTRLDENEPIDLAPPQGSAGELSSQTRGGHPIRSYTCRLAGIPIKYGCSADFAVDVVEV